MDGKPEPEGSPANKDQPIDQARLDHGQSANAPAAQADRGPRHGLEPPAPEPRRRRYLLRWLGLPLLTVVAATATGIGVAASIHMPEIDKALEDFVPKLVTHLQDRGGQTFRSYSRENRILLKEGEIPPLLHDATVAVEDANFYRHGGIDLKGVARALLKNYITGKRTEGASTITMQLARELFYTRERTWKRKIEESFTAVHLEKQFSKQQILTMYVNLINYGHGNYSVEAAAQAYFNKTVADLTLAEAATLAGIPQRPASHSPYNNKERTKKRRNVVLKRMLDEGYIDSQQYQEAIIQPILTAQRQRERQIGPYYAEEIRRYLAKTYGTDILYDRGLEVQTTLDRGIQRAAEYAVRQGLQKLDQRKGWRGPIDHLEPGEEAIEDLALPSWKSDEELIPGHWYRGIVLTSGAKTAQVKIAGKVFELIPKGFRWTRKKRPKDLLKPADVAWFYFSPQADEELPLRLMLTQEPELEAAVVVLESATGAVRAMIGGWDYQRNEFNRATQARRQVGSAFKPFVYGAALENGFTAADTIFDGPVLFPGATEDDSYSPRNNKRKYHGIITLRRALERSVNVSAVKLLDLVGAQQVVDFARRCGMQSNLPPYPSLALGAADLTPLELAAAYAAIVNHGVFVEPYLIERILSRDGRVIEEHPPQAQKAMEPEVAYVLTRMLKGVVDHGTGHALANFDIDLGGKTGTTDRYSDAWFAGFTPRYTIVSWVGYDKNSSIGRGMTGAAAALPIWKLLIERGLEDGWLGSGETFRRPPGLVEVEIEPATGLRWSPEAEAKRKEIFVEGTEPERAYSEQWQRIMLLPWYQQEAYYLPKEGERMPSQIKDWTAVQDSWKTKDRGPRG